MVNVLKILTKYYSHRKNNGHDPFNQNVRRFWSKTQWSGLVQPEKFRKNWSTFRGGPLFRSDRSEFCLSGSCQNNINTVESWFLAPSVLEFTIIWAKPYFPSPHKHCNFTPDNLPIIRTTVVEEFGILLLLIFSEPHVHSSTNLITLYFTNAVKLTDMITWLHKPEEKTQICLFSLIYIKSLNLLLVS